VLVGAASTYLGIVAFLLAGSIGAPLVGTYLFNFFKGAVFSNTSSG